MIALGKAEFEYKISTQYDEDLIDLDIIKKKDLLANTKVKDKYKINLIKQIIMLLAIYFKAIFMYFKSLFIKPKISKKLFLDYYNKRILGHFENDSDSLLIDLNKFGKIINFFGLKTFFSQQLKMLILSFKYKILHNTIAKQSYYILKIISLTSYYKPNVIIGALDSSAVSDIYSIILKKYGIKFGCYSHGYNYEFRTEYIYIPFDFYFVWSNAHLKQIEAGCHIKSDCTFYITGSPFYNKVNFEDLQKDFKNNTLYDILVIGEYYYDDYSAQPFNSRATKKLANVLNKYTDKYKICIRPRMKDEYYEDMYKILKNNVSYSLPANQDNLTNSLFNDIQNSKIIISTFSGGIHDALLLHKPVIQTNFIGIKEPKEFDVNHAVYYTDTSRKLESMIEKIFNKKLDILDYDKNNKYYINSGKFNIDKAREIIDEHI